MKFNLGFLGGGQLARMSIQAAQRMALTALSVDLSSKTPASGVAEARVANLLEPESYIGFFNEVEFVLLENEFIDADRLRAAMAKVGFPEDRVTPSLESLGLIQDKLVQRQRLQMAGVSSPDAVEAERGPVELGFPLVLKSRRGGYDGKGTLMARTPEEYEAARPVWEKGGWLAESFVPFRRELAVMVMIDDQDRAWTYPTMVSEQVDQVCDLVYPAEVDASEIAVAAVRAMRGRGLYGVELFELEDGGLMVNEIAPRPHNSGHYTLDWGGPSQFEQHVRLSLGLLPAWPQGIEVAMANLLGQSDGLFQLLPAIEAAMEGDQGVYVHWYGKEQQRKGRKMGHINAVGPNGKKRAQEARARFYAAL
jgi:5-(carboxyamino)imidazole ribonucleotide synthase